MTKSASTAASAATTRKSQTTKPELNMTDSLKPEGRRPQKVGRNVLCKSFRGRPAAPKGFNKSAQGNALGTTRRAIALALKGHNKPCQDQPCCALSGRGTTSRAGVPGRCPGLVC